MEVKGYSIRTKTELGFDEAAEKAIEELKKEGFGVLTEIDVKATLKKKLDVDFPKYVILGTCNPPFAHKSLQAEKDIGLLLPCNVIIYEDDGNTVVAALNPNEALAVVKNEALATIASEVTERLMRVIASFD